MAEIFGLVTGAVQALAAVDRAVALFGRLQNAPKQIRLVRILLAQIDHDLNTLKQSSMNDDEGAGGNNNHDQPGRRIPPATISEIEDSLNECRAFVNKYNDDFSDKASRGRVFWSSVKHTAKLDEIRARIVEIYPLIITPWMMRLLLERIPAPDHQHQGRGPLPLPRTTHDGAVPETISTTTTDLRDVLETGAVEFDAALKNLRGATLTLDGDIPPEYRTLFLDELQLATRDEMTTMLRFSCTKSSIRVQHLVQFSTPPYLSSVDSSDVEFRATHPVTILRDDGHLLLHASRPRYCFADVPTRRKFQELVRARTLLAEVRAIEIFPLFSSNGDGGGLDRCSTGGTGSTGSKTTSSSSVRSIVSVFSFKSILGKKTDRRQKQQQTERCLANCEPLQIWQRQQDAVRAGVPGPGVTTMTFVVDTEQLLRKGGGGGGRAARDRDKWRVLEWHAGDLESGEAPRVVAGKRSEAPWAVEMWWAIRCAGAAPGVRITFGSKKVFEAELMGIDSVAELETVVAN
ncbi:hypothetical protein QBC39DRAFT_330731 [Podospora conica]|nr:hypothetical protein QBC39DRAFT_330731 [Schizothecium conicum]